MREKIRDGITALLGMLGFIAMSSVSPPQTILGQALNVLIGLGLIGAAYLVWVLWDKLFQKRG